MNLQKAALTGAEKGLQTIWQICQHRESFILNVFLSVCHGMIEDTLLFMVVGASLGIMVGFRLVIAVLVTRLLALCWDRRHARLADLTE